MLYPALMDNTSIRSPLVFAALAVSLVLAGCPGDNGADGSSCTVTENDDTGVSTITCEDGTTAEVASGADGTACSVEENDDGTKTITCDDGTEVTVSDGEPGDPGDPGDPGEPGEPCTVVDNDDGTTTVTCGEDEVVISDGAAGDSCTVTDNGDGSRTIACEDGSEVTIADGVDGETGGNVEVGNFHGIGALQSTGEFEDGAKSFVDALITSATADEAGVVTVDFTVTNQDEEATPVEGLTGVSAIIAKLVPASGDVSWNTWVPYIYRTQTVAAGDWPAPEGTSAVQATTENTGTLTELGGGAYTYTFATDISAVTGYDGAAVEYDRSLVHRVSVMMGGHSGATAEATYDFVPDGTANAESRDIVQTETCQNCHGWEFHGHGGNRLTVQGCVTCHNAGNTDPNGSPDGVLPGETLDFKVMIHKIHAGGELQSIPGEDGEVWDDPSTEEDESADNGEYAIWGYRDAKHEWWKVGFPAKIENCTACHQGDGAEADNWQTNPSRAACGSCHDEIDFSLEEEEGGHGGDDQDDDDGCLDCHEEDGLAAGVAEAHDWLANDPRMDEEFDIEVTVSEPNNGEFFEDGESPIVTIVVNNADTGALIPGTTIASDGTAEGCTLVDEDDDGDWDPCPDGDGAFTTAQMFVSGPRANRTPVLTTGARAQIVSGSTGTWDLSAIDNNAAALSLTVDGGQLVHGEDAVGGDTLLPGVIEVKMVTASFAVLTAATTGEIVAWLNANTAFAARAIAWDEAGNVGIRSRNLGRMHAIQLRSSPVATTVFGGDLVAKTPSSTGSYASNKLYSDPKAVPAAADVTYTYNLDPVDDLVPGTYTIRVEFADAGSIRGTDSFRATSSARATFQVGAADEEPFVARNCDTCHRGPNGVGLDMHTNKQLDDFGAETCGACHDYQPQYATSLDPATGRVRWGSSGPGSLGSIGWTGAKPISRRVHAVHFGSSLSYPNATVDHSDEPVGRNWDITLPQDVRNCETCHPADTSGTWLTNPGMIPCSGCHDSDAAMAHMQSMRFDSTPENPWSGDEEEACGACHADSAE
ncbi:MAG: OmcA/MtrC family decaheme c-type cytochrome [Deltaproteobacteria bacterium]|nr:OmcA/MtrC family decaheme c-type cytochrome [Deltaproteobacteria bacterium]